MYSPIDVPFPDDAYVDSIGGIHPMLKARMRGIRYLTAVACLKACTNHGDQQTIRELFHLPGPYQPCPICKQPLDHKGQCYQDHDHEDQGAT